MEYLSVPNLPSRRASLVLADGRMDDEARAGLETLGIKAVYTYPHSALHPAVGGHPDIMLFHLGGNRMIYAPGTDTRVLAALEAYGFELIEGATRLSAQYPGDVAYNVARVGRYAFHNLRHTDRILLDRLEAEGIEPIHVNQGYSKCSISIVNSNSMITADRGIERAAARKGLEVLYIGPETGIRLPGLDYGFIGGSTGLAGPDIWLVNGNLDRLGQAGMIREFLKARGVRPVSLSSGPVTDVGSILPVCTG